MRGRCRGPPDGSRGAALSLSEAACVAEPSGRESMIGEVLQKGTWRFPEIKPIVRTTGIAVDLFRTRRLLVATAASLAIAVVAMGLAGVGYMRHNSRAADAQLAASRVEAANIDLQDELARLRDMMAPNNGARPAAQGRVPALAEEPRARPHPAPAAAFEPAAPAKSDKVS